MTGLVPCSSRSARSSLLSYALSPSRHLAGSTRQIRRSASGPSCASPPVNRMAIRRPLASASAWIFVLRPPRERPTACFFSPFSAGCGAVGFHVGRVDHLHACGSSVPGEPPEQIFPDAAPRPPNKPIVDRRRRTVFGRAIAPAAAAFQHMHDAADDAPIVRSLHASNVRRQVWLDPFPLLVTQPKQVLAHVPDAPNESNPYGIRIVVPPQQN